MKKGPRTRDKGQGPVSPRVRKDLADVPDWLRKRECPHKEKYMSGRRIMPAGITGKERLTALIDNTFLAYNAARLRQGCELFTNKMLAPDTVVGMSLAGALTPAGLGCSTVVPLIKAGFVDWIVATGANMYHDLHFAFNLPLHVGSHAVDDTDLRRNDVVRIYDVFLPEHHFTDFEEKMQAIFSDIGAKTISIREFMTHIGNNIDDKNSILRTAADMNVPVYCPAIQDSMIGLQAWLYKQMHALNVDAFADMREIIDICYEAKNPGALLIGGGVPKNYIFQSMLVTHQEFEYAIQLTMDTPETGGLSGATLDEARSWGKVSESARSVTVHSDATITLPLLVAAVRSRLAKDHK